jgi:hypothetical protein
LRKRRLEKRAGVRSSKHREFVASACNSDKKQARIDSNFFGTLVIAEVGVPQRERAIVRADDIYVSELETLCRMRCNAADAVAPVKIGIAIIDVRDS